MKKIKKEDLDLIEEKRNELVEIFDDIKAKVEKANEFRSEIYDKLSELRDEAQNYYDDRSEKWQEGENGEQYTRWVDALDEMTSDLSDELDEYDPPFWLDLLEDIPETPADA